jgi:hypothetical protein
MFRPIVAAALAAAALALAGSAQAAIVVYNVFLDGPSEVPPNPSLGTGFATVTVDDAAHTLALNVAFGGLTDPTTNSHIHCCTATPGVSTAGVATTTPTFAGFPVGVTSGTYSNILDLTLASSYNPAFVTANGGIAGAEFALLTGIAAGRAYLNIHTSGSQGGEIRGFLTPAPEPGTWALMIAGFALVGATMRRRRTAFA